jgi:molybdate transport repressor ModE-like protein
MLPDLDWNLVRTFLATAEAGSLSAAARQLGISQPTAGRHVADLENVLGVRLFDRTAAGLRITEVGTSLVENAQAMRERAEGLRRIAEGRSEAIEGTVRISASEMVAVHLMPEILTALHRAEPRIQIELVASVTADNLLLREADIALRMFRPQQADVITRHVTDLRLGIFAHQNYIQRYGRPGDLDAIRGHAVVGYDRVDIMIRGFRRAGFDVARDFFSFRCDSQIAGWAMVMAGYGIGIGPVYLGRDEPALVQLFTDTPIEGMELPIWLTAHRDLRHSRRIRLVYDFLAEKLSALDLCAQQCPQQ